MKRLFMVAAASLFTLLASLQLQASLVPPLKLKTLTSKADVIVVGRVSGIEAGGLTMIHPQFIDASVPGHKFLGSLEVQTILKGTVPNGRLLFNFALPDAPVGLLNELFFDAPPEVKAQILRRNALALEALATDAPPQPPACHGGGVGLAHRGAGWSH